MKSVKNVVVCYLRIKRKVSWTVKGPQSGYVRKEAYRDGVCLFHVAVFSFNPPAPPFLGRMAAMGDRRRFQAFSDFIIRTYPNVKRIADVAGGHGLLSVELLLRGFEPVIIDPRRADTLPHRTRKRLRKEALRIGVVPKLERVFAMIEEVDLDQFDLIVGMHPDQATEPIVREATRRGKPFAVVPCCVMPLDGIGRTFAEWVEYLASLAPGSRVASLPIRGANIAVFRRAPDLNGNP